MAPVDLAILAVILLSALLSLLRGFVVEVLSLTIWIGSVWLAAVLAGPLADRLDLMIAVPSLRLGIAAAIIFLSGLLIGALLTWLMKTLVHQTGLTATDRMLGMLFGALRGLVIVFALVLLAGFTPLPRDPWWGQSQMLPRLASAAIQVSQFLPDGLRDQLSYAHEPLPVPRPDQTGG